MKLFNIYICLFIFLQRSKAQQASVFIVKDEVKFSSISVNEIRPIKIGEKIPNIDLGEVLNYPGLTRAKISDFKGKLLILDFWSVRCSNCIALFPKVEALRKKYQGRVEILPVGFDTKRNGEIKNFVRIRRGTKLQMNIPTSIQKVTDTLLSSLFPFQGLPHQVWIDPNGILIGRTDGNALTEENMTNILNGEKVSFTPFRSKYLDVSIAPFLIKQQSDSIKKYGSVVSAYIDSIKSSAAFDIQPDSSYIRLHSVNSDIFALYRRAYNNKYKGHLYFGGGPENYFNKKIVFENTDSTFFQSWYNQTEKNNWEMEDFKRNNLFCYELILPAFYDLNYAYEHMIKDLDEFFCIKSYVDKRKVKCLEVIRTKKTDKLNVKQGGQETLFEASPLQGRLRNAPMKQLIAHLNLILKNDLLIFDGTNYSENIDIDIDLPPGANRNDVKKLLNKYDLDFIEVEKELDVLVLKKIGPNPFNNASNLQN